MERVLTKIEVSGEDKGWYWTDRETPLLSIEPVNMSKENVQILVSQTDLTNPSQHETITYNDSIVFYRYPAIKITRKLRPH